MINLLKADLYRLKKDKALKFILIALLVMAVIVSGVMLLAKELMKSMPEEAGGGIFTNDTFSGKYLFHGMFSIADEMGIMVIVLICILVGKDFAFGTIRNKLITGAKRKDVYFSSLITSLIAGTICIVVYTLAILIFGSILLGYGPKFDGGELLFILKTYGLGFLVFASVMSLAVLFTTLTQSYVAPIMISLITVVVLSLIVSVLSSASTTVNNILECTIFSQSMSIAYNTVDKDMVIKIICSSVVAIPLINYIGLMLFKRADLK